MKKFLLFIMLSQMAASWACSPVRPMVGFVHQNDQNGDGMLNAIEWQAAQLNDDLIAKYPIGNPEVFAYLDRNGNGQLDKGDPAWYGLLRYRQSPCRMWAQRNRLRVLSEPH